MTPAVQAAKRAGIAYQLHEYRHDAGNSHFGLEAAEKLGLNPASVFKTPLVSCDGDPRNLAVTDGGWRYFSMSLRK